MTAITQWLARVATRTWRIAWFLVYFGYEFLKSNVLVFWEIVTPSTHATPALIEVPVRSRTMVEIVSIGNLINLTPGTLTIEFTLDPPRLYVHGMFVHDPQAFIADLQRLEGRMLAAMRPVGRDGDGTGTGAGDAATAGSAGPAGGAGPAAPAGGDG